MIRRSYPSVMAIKMVLKPLALPAAFNQFGFVLAGLAGLAQRMVLR
jgi:hypothetical protein